MTEPIHLIGPMAAVLTAGSHDDNLLKVGDFWKVQLRKYASKIPRPPSGSTNPTPNTQLLVSGRQETDD